MKLQPEEREALARYIYSLTAIELDASKGYLIEGRLGSLAAECGGSYAELLRRAQQDPHCGLRRRIIDAITTGETLFFRDSAPFELLRHKLLPDALDRCTRARNRPLRIWSAACSTGQEVYSIGIAVKEVLGIPERYGVQILGTDISEQAVARASRGIFQEVEILRGLAPGLLARFFRQNPSGWQIADEVRALATFRTLNLMEDFSRLGRFDIIFCRNVAIYFNRQDRTSLFQRLGRQLEAGGTLVVGSTESLEGICPQLVPQRHLRAVYYTWNDILPEGRTTTVQSSSR